MPELPEMETYKSLLEQHVVGKIVTNVVINREKSINVQPEQFSHQVVNQKIESIKRRAKYLIFHLQNGSCLLLHLMLGGQMFYGTEEEKPDRTVQIQLSFGDHHLYFIGLRLGYLHLLSPEMVQKEFQEIGPEPFDPNFSLAAFLERLKNKRGGLKTTLLNQEFIAGIGNRYSNEILWHAQLLPERKINGLSEDHKVQLYESIKFIFKQAVQNGGYTEELFYPGDNKTGGYKMYVHGREGEACKRCSAPIVKEEISSRKTYYCEQCQH
ncbi:bifunctional DNA-formamidopyrimidine glycosylase/DNA-(apurinic or apyrimidinic site) lyase [bacterium LRH843]|nr:bifunctional DNA-formamidopyrimidine glycosylase/DNA-(apurinic or apyrimidinic site) lyase [bacterium LRH843]